MKSKFFIGLFALALCAFIIQQAVVQRQLTGEIRKLVSRSDLIYVCERRNTEFVVTRILKNNRSDVVEYPAVGSVVRLNRQRLNLDSDFGSLQVVVFSGPGVLRFSGGELPNQSEIPIMGDRLSTYPISVGQLMQIIEPKNH